MTVRWDALESVRGGYERTVRPPVVDIRTKGPTLLGVEQPLPLAPSLLASADPLSSDEK